MGINYSSFSFYEDRASIIKLRILLQLFAFQILLCSRKHKLDPVQLVYFAGTGVIVDSYDIGVGILSTDFLDYAFPYDVVGQTAKGLGADDVFHSGVDQLQHLTRQEPALAGLVA